MHRATPPRPGSQQARGVEPRPGNRFIANAHLLASWRSCNIVRARRTSLEFTDCYHARSPAARGGAIVSHRVRRCDEDGSCGSSSGVETRYVRHLRRGLDRSGERLRSESLRAMTDRLVHRGPDDSGATATTMPRWGSAGCRSSTWPAGISRLANEDGTVWTVFNGEIYNFPALRRRLEAKGHQLRSTGRHRGPRASLRG